MRAIARAWILAAAMLVIAGVASRARAQAADTAHTGLSYDDASEIAYLFNSLAGLRKNGETTIAAGDSVQGNVAVLAGPLTVAGTVHGSVIVVNGSVTIAPTGHVDNDVIVTGGGVTGADSAHVGGVVQAHPDPLKYHQAGELIIAESPEGAAIPDANWFRHWLRRHVRTHNGFDIGSGPYNRVEGLPLIGGPSIRQNTGIGVLRLSLLGIYRSAEHFEWKGDNLGWNASGELTVGGVRNIRFGISGYDVVRPTEQWQLRDAEVSLASFFLRQDYRDYYNTKGARASVGVHDGRKLSLELGVRNERWEPRESRNPFSVFKGGVDWRPNPKLDDGRLWIGEAVFRLDTRNNVRDPWTGWLIDATFEAGGTDQLTLGPATILARDSLAGTKNRVRYTRLLADFTRYNRVSPQSQLNFRLVFGAGFNGDALPLERRFALGGAGTLPGYDFRNSAHSENVLTCDGGPHPADGLPAQCDHMLLGQVEFRHDARIRLFGRQDAGGAERFRIDRQVAFVAFADGGRGWLTGERFRELRYPSTSFPSLESFKYDAGAGVDVHYIGFYVAKSLTDWSNSAKFIIRLRHRF